MSTSPNESRPAVAARLLDGAALFLVLVVIGLRPLVQEVTSTALAGFERAVGGAGAIDPTFSLLMTLMILTAALLVWIGRLLHPRPWRLLGIEWGGAVLLVVAVASCCFASDRRTAINETANWLALLILAILGAQLFARPRAASLGCAVIVASAATFAFQCVRQVRYEFDDTIKSYEEMREKFWADQGVSLDDPQVTLFERRLRGREAFGYASHSNVAGGYLVGAAFVAGAVACSRFGGVSGVAWMGLAALNALLAMGLFAAVWLTVSRGAIAAGVIGILLFVAGWAARRRVAANPRRWLVAGWIVVLAVVGVVIVYGSARGGLPTSSMEFRWGYWRNSMKLVAAHPWLGVGAGNFPIHYPSVKPVTDPEEVADPHNFLVTATTQWGVPGGLAIIAMLVGASAVAVMRRTDVEPPRAPPADTDWLRSAGWVALWTAALAIAIFALRHAFVGSSDATEYEYAFDAPRRVWIVAFLIAYVSPYVLGLTGRGVMTNAGRAAIAAGLVAMLLHACIEMTLFQYGSAITAMAMLALLGSGPVTSGVRATRRRAWAGLAASAVALLLVIWFAAVPTTEVVSALSRARLAAQQSASAGEVRAAYEAAVRADAYDPAPPAELAAWLMSGETPSAEGIADAIESARLAARRNPASAGVWRAVATAYRLAFETTGELSALQDAAGAVRRALASYPESPSMHLMLAEVLERIASVGSGADREIALREAADAYARALELDARRDPAEIRRFTDAQRDAIRARLSSIRAMGAVSRGS